jgi:hypothetical protein
MARPDRAPKGVSAATWDVGASPNVIEELDPEECLALLAGEEVGRLVVSGRPPQVFPVNFALDGATVLVRTAPGTKLDAVRADAEVAFEVDSIDRASHTGWSVVVTGKAREELHLHDDGSARPEPWSSGVRAYWLRLDPTAITGRRVRTGPDPARGTGSPPAVPAT